MSSARDPETALHPSRETGQETSGLPDELAQHVERIPEG
jgi:hypothetical protein